MTSTRPRLLLLEVPETVPISEREQFVLHTTELGPLHDRLKRAKSFSEAFYFCTCNRALLLVVVPTGDTDSARSECGEILQQFTAFDVPLHVVSEHADQAACFRFLSIASGLASAIIGEHEILGQIRSFLALSQRVRVVGPILNRILQQSIHIARRTRGMFPISEGNVSWAGLTLRQIGDFSRQQSQAPTVLIAGWGPVTTVIARSLLRQDFVASVRVTDPRDRWPTESGVRIPFGDCEVEIAKADVVVAMVSRIPMRLNVPDDGRDRLLIDLGVPRNLEVPIQRNERTRSYDIDTFVRLASNAVKAREDAAAQAVQWLKAQAAEMHRYVDGYPVLMGKAALVTQLAAVFEAQLESRGLVTPSSRRPGLRSSLHRRLFGVVNTYWPDKRRA